MGERQFVRLCAVWRSNQESDVATADNPQAVAEARHSRGWQPIKQQPEHWRWNVVTAAATTVINVRANTARLASQ